MKPFTLIAFLLLMQMQTTNICAQDITTLKFADPLQSNMVIQQNKPFKVWGTAASGEEITITADWMKTSVKVIADGTNSFIGIIPVPVAKKGDFTKHMLSISNSKSKIVLNNLLIGDVWFCSGQSNMQFSLKDVPDSAKEITDANNYSNIRLFSASLNFSNDPINTINGTWQECSSSVARSFSAVAYYFGNEVYKKINIPVGLIFSGIGASGAQAYVPKDVLANNHLLDTAYLQPYLNSPKSKEPMNGGFSFEKVVRPFLLYNAMIHPFENLSIKGFCWYQGEANHTERDSYTQLMYSLINSWRENFQQGNLPFYYVQIAPYGHEKNNPELTEDAFFREAQEKISMLGNTAMAVTMDVGEVKDIHPKKKKPVGQRLANAALNQTYGMLDIVYHGPHFNYVSFEKNKAIVHFLQQTIGSGLTTNDGLPPTCFFVAGEDQKFYAAQAEIVGDKIIAVSAKVKRPVAIRYAFTSNAITNLQNKEGLPALPFRSDNWSEPEMKK